MAGIPDDLEVVLIRRDLVHVKVPFKRLRHGLFLKLRSVDLLLVLKDALEDSEVVQPN